MINVYSTTFCPYCVNAKRLLTEKGMNFEEINIEEKGISREELVEITGGRSVPQIVINDKPIGGYDNLVQLDQAGELSA